MQVPKPSTTAAAAAQAVKTAACPSVRFCSRRRIQQQALNRRSRAQHRSQRRLVRALEAEAEVEEPSTHKKRGRKKSSRPQLPSVRGFMQQTSCPFTSCRPLHEQLLLCSQLHISKQSKTRLYLGALVCTQANTVCIVCNTACDNKGFYVYATYTCLACSNCVGDASACR